ncbi:MAG: ABC transporter substrate-binding protein [Woeseiaceae bacterium]|nr:ABC transporter substrate-binding protein [Woeseiaceae bacterium]
MKAPVIALCSALVLPCTPAAAADKAAAAIGIVALSERTCRNEPFLAGMRELGYVEGRDFRIECRHAAGRYDRVAEAARDLVATRPAVILALGQAFTTAVTRATREIPIVMVSSSDPVVAGFAASYARPGGNATGYTYYGDQLTAKRLELLKAIVPNLRHVAVLDNPEPSATLRAIYLRDTREAARTLRLKIRIYAARNEPEIDQAFHAMARDGMQAVYTLPYVTFADTAQLIADRARFHNLASVHFVRRFPAFGGLMSYGPDYDMLHRRTANYVDKILKGAKPGELPIDKPERLEFVINRSTADELGLTIPENLLLRADKVIE